MRTKSSALTAAMCAALVLGVTACGGGSGSGDSGDRKSEGKGGSPAGDGGKSGDQRGDDAPEGKGGKGGSAPSGVEKRPANEILRASLKALKEAGTWRITADGGDTGSADFRMDTSGNCAGTFTNLGTTSQVLKKGDKVWLKMEDAYWNTSEGKQTLAKVPEAKGKYLYGSSESSFSLLMVSATCMLGDALAGGAFAKDAPEAVKGPVATVDGQKAVAVEVQEGQGAEKRTNVYYVATEGAPYLLKATTGKKEAIRLSGFGETFDVPATPSAGESVDAAKVEKASSGITG
ncbi:hypothetical protein ACIP6P_16385 [Streptomyces sp. NPDC088729]|uniref:hypothetical protein n=1 Tax=Streptomyces sp. NPDC088729 TaxID=3365876 RepID=UPI0037F434FB